jgi:hypothetical protein
VPRQDILEEVLVVSSIRFGVAISESSLCVDQLIKLRTSLLSKERVTSRTIPSTIRHYRAWWQHTSKMETSVTSIANDYVVMSLRKATNNTWNGIKFLLSLYSSGPCGIKCTDMSKGITYTTG